MIVIAQFQPGDDAGGDFSPTLPPPMAALGPLDSGAVPLPLPDEVARLLFSLGMKGLHATLMDVESMVCLSSWHIGDAGERGATGEQACEQAGGASLSTAMATIVQLNGTMPDQTLTRQLDARSWAFAWRVDGFRVAVAEARYRQPTAVCTDRDVAVVRQLCAAGIEAGQLRRAEAVNDRFPSSALDASVALASPLSAVQPMRARWVGQLVQRMRWRWLLALGLAGAVCLAAALQIQSTREAEARRLRLLTDATMMQQLLRVLAAGDYGEVQANLETFESLGYFKGAVVVDARRRAVAQTGAVPALRIGHALTGAEVAGARAVPLTAAGSNTDGQLFIWGPELPTPRVSAALEQVLIACAVPLLLAALAGAALWAWQRRRGSQAGADQALLSPSLSEAPP